MNLSIGGDSRRMAQDTLLGMLYFIIGLFIVIGILYALTSF